jgi:hypothetical protein
MQVIRFSVTDVDASGTVEALAEKPLIKICASSMEDLHHEAREALIERFGDCHVAYRIVINNGLARVSTHRPIPQQLFHSTTTQRGPGLAQYQIE